eukprot:716063-Hanusia_phi.AAC.3
MKAFSAAEELRQKEYKPIEGKPFVNERVLDLIVGLKNSSLRATHRQMTSRHSLRWGAAEKETVLSHVRTFEELAALEVIRE